MFEQEASWWHGLFRHSSTSAAQNTAQGHKLQGATTVRCLSDRPCAHTLDMACVGPCDRPCAHIYLYPHVCVCADVFDYPCVPHFFSVRIPVKIPVLIQVSVSVLICVLISVLVPVFVPVMFLTIISVTVPVPGPACVHPCTSSHLHEIPVIVRHNLCASSFNVHGQSYVRRCVPVLVPPPLENLSPSDLFTPTPSHLQPSALLCSCKQGVAESAGNICSSLTQH